MKNKLIVAGILGGLAYGYWRKSQEAVKPKKKKSKKKNKRLKNAIPEERLPDYNFDKGSLNKYEKRFKKHLAKVAKITPIKVKKREPKKLKNGLIEQAYVVNRGTGTTYMVIPKINNLERYSFAVHEKCHIEKGHQNPNDKDFQLSPVKQEQQVEKCIRKTFKKDKLPNYFKRSKADIAELYQP